jgi:hypothetical protein
MKSWAARLTRLGLTALLVAATACAGIAAKGTAEDAVARFHQQLDGEQFDQIYGATDQLFKNAMTPVQFTEMLTTIHRKVGRVVSSTQTSFYSRDEAGTNPGSYISLTYDTQFADGLYTESFNWRVAGTGVMLVGYRIDVPKPPTK